ncbi:hypothetical protein [Nonomuraea sp. NPDC050310]|uniref:hypothetical protein n=1 Tax=Nonomuraea sp. NPDC050310 TaxID=3154935 RepID=UPI0033E71F9C
MTGLATTPRSGADTFARYAMIACAFVSPLTILAGLLLSPIQATAEGQAYVQALVDHAGSYPATAWLAALGALTIIPALLAVSKVARAGRPVLGLVGTILAFSLAVPISTDSDDLIYAAHKAGLDVPTITRIEQVYVDGLPTSPLGMLWFAAMLGLLLLGLAALLGRSAPAWAAIALVIAPVLVPLPWILGLSTLLAAVPWAIMVAGMGGVALALLKEPVR